VRLTSKQSAALKRWFTFWDRNENGAVDPRDICNALYSLNVFSLEQKEEVHALIEAVCEEEDQGDDAKFNFAQFRTLMTYPKCGIAKTVLGVLEKELFTHESAMPFHIRVQAHNREKLIAGLMSKNSALRKESEKQLSQVEAQLFRRDKEAEKAEQERKEREARDAQATSSRRTPASKSMALPQTPVQEEKEAVKPSWGKVRGDFAKPREVMSASSKMASVVNDAMKGRVDLSAGVKLRSKELFKRLPAESKMMTFKPSDFFAPERSKSTDLYQSTSKLWSSEFGDPAPTRQMGEW